MAKVIIWTENGSVVIIIVDIGIKTTATVKIELKTLPSIKSGTFFCTMEKKWILKIVRKNSNTKSPDTIMIIGSLSTANTVIIINPAPHSANAIKMLL